MAGSREMLEERDLRQLEELRRCNEEAERAKLFKQDMWREEAENAPPYVNPKSTLPISL